MALLLWQIADDMCALGSVLPSAPRANIVIGRTVFIYLYAPSPPTEMSRSLGCENSRLCEMCNEPSGHSEQRSK